MVLFTDIAVPCSYYPGYIGFYTSGARVTNCTTPFVWKPNPSAQLPMNFTDWAPTQPDCYGGVEFCIGAVSVSNYQWNDIDCASNCCPICEVDL